MSFEVRTNHQARYLEIRYQGAVTAAERLEALEELLSKNTSVEFHRVLIAFRDAHCVSEDFAASNRVAARLARATVGLNWRIAYVTDVESPLDSDFTRLAEARRVPFKCFKNRLTALAWLLDKRQR